jgi:hypothetical protein
MSYDDAVWLLFDRLERAALEGGWGEDEQRE